VTIYEAGQSFSELLGDRHGVSANASKTAGQASRGVRRGHERDGPDDPIRELRFHTFRPEILRREIMRDADACVRVLVKPDVAAARAASGRRVRADKSISTCSVTGKEVPQLRRREPFPPVLLARADEVIE
jgi:hypothetical protein